MFDRNYRFAGVLAIGILCACSDAPQAPEPTTSEVVARFGDLAITAEDVDARILSLPMADRPQPGENLDTWIREQIRELVVESRLRQQAGKEKLAESEEFRDAERETEQEVIVQTCLNEILPPQDPITDDDLRAAYEQQSEAFSAPERRLVYHIFLRRDGENAEARIESLRDRVLGGENFLRLARTESDSESRHQDGGIGWIRQGQLPEGFERVIFQLDEGVPSKPLATRDGFHLFYVDQVMPARTVDLEEARKALYQRLAVERRSAAMAELEATFTKPADTMVLSREEFERVVAENDATALVLRLGEVELDLKDLRRRVRRSVERDASGSQQPVTFDTAWGVLEGSRIRASILHHCRDQGLVAPDDVEARLAKWRDSALVGGQRQQRMHDLILKDEGKLRRFYDNNLGQFSTEVKWHLRKLQVPFGDDPATMMARLEDAASRQASLDSVHADVGGEVSDLGPLTQSELRALRGKLPALVSPLEVGEISDPFRFGDHLEIVELVARSEPEPLSFDEVSTRQRVATAYVKAYTREVYGELKDEILASAELEFDDEALAELQAGSPEDISVEQLEEALENL